MAAELVNYSRNPQHSWGLPSINLFVGLGCCSKRSPLLPLHRLSGDLKCAVDVFEFRARAIEILAALDEFVLR